MPSNSDTLHTLVLAVQRWRNPSAWERVMQDEPLDPMKGEWVPDGDCNVISTGPVMIPAGPVGTSWTNGSILVETNFTQMEMRIVARTAQRDVFGMLDKIAPLRGTESPGQGRLSETMIIDSCNLPVDEFVWGVPWPRNREERRILKSIRKRLPALIRQAERKFGPRQQERDAAWNDSFWKMVTRDSQDFLKTRK